MTAMLHADAIFGAAARQQQIALADATPQPSTTPTLAAILHDVRVYIRRYVVVTDDQAIAVALWAAHTHAIAAADATPYLQITSATARAGKTLLLEVLEPIVARPWLTGRVTAASLVRKTDAEHPTLLLDESDAAFKSDREYAEALRGLLNSGYRRSGRATICVGQGANLTYKDFRTFAPKAIAGIGELPDTVADRSIRITLRRRTRDEPRARWRERDGHAAAAPLHEQLVAWAGDLILEALRDARPSLPSGLGDRAADVWEPLVAIADQAGGDWPDRARRAALALAGSIEDTDIVIELLRDVAEVIDADPRDVLPSTELLATLVAQADRPWADWREGRPLTARGLAQLLGPLDIHPADHHIPGARRGYRRDALADAIARYLPSHVRMCAGPNRSGPDLADPMCAADPSPLTSESPKTPIDTGSRAHAHIDRGDEGTDGCLPLGGEGDDAWRP